MAGEADAQPSDGIDELRRGLTAATATAIATALAAPATRRREHGGFAFRRRRERRGRFCFQRFAHDHILPKAFVWFCRQQQIGGAGGIEAARKKRSCQFDLADIWHLAGFQQRLARACAAWRHAAFRIEAHEQTGHAAHGSCRETAAAGAAHAAADTSARHIGACCDQALRALVRPPIAYRQWDAGIVMRANRQHTGHSGRQCV